MDNPRLSYASYRRRAALLGLACVLVVAAPLALGWSLPRTYEATRVLHLPAPPDRVFSTLSDVAHWQRWMPTIGPTRRAGVDANGSPRFRTHADPRHVIDYVLVAAERPRRVVVRIDMRPRRIETSWTFTITPEGDGSRVELHERGATDSPMLRFAMRYITGYGVALLGVENALSAHFARHDGGVP